LVRYSIQTMVNKRYIRFPISSESGKHHKRSTTSLSFREDLFVIT
jgi:hypothetical protein